MCSWSLPWRSSTFASAGLNPAWLDAARTVDRASAHAELNLADEIAILSLGTVCERKGQADWLHALAELPQASWSRLRCLIVGDRPMLGPGVPNTYSVELHRLRDALAAPQRHRVEIIAETKSVQRYFRAADLFVCTSRIESAPRVLLEAMAVGLPIITTPVFGIPEQVREGINALFYAPGDTRALAAALGRLTTDNMLLGNLAKASPVVLEALPSHDQMIVRYEQVVLEAAS